jgi:transposase InsO family protein
MVTGLDLKGLRGSRLSPCDGCAKGKHHQAPFPKHARRRANNVTECLHCDLQGPFEQSIHGYKYVMVVVDDYSHKGWKEYLKHKSDTDPKLQDLITRLETQTEHKVKYIRSDRGGEFMGKEIKKYLQKKGITDELSAPHTPQQNGVAERYNQVTHEHALAMLHEAKMKPSFWPEAHEYAAYTRNRSPSSALPDLKTPNELCHGRRPDVQNLRIKVPCPDTSREPDFQIVHPFLRWDILWF